MTPLLSPEQVEIIAPEGAARITWHITRACPVALSHHRDFNRVREAIEQDLAETLGALVLPEGPGEAAA